MPIVANVYARMFRTLWGQLVLLVIGVVTAFQLAGDADLADTGPTMDRFVGFLNNLRWATLGVAAVIGIPALLEDQRRGALELYLGRAVNTGEYLVGKVIAVLSLCILSVFLPALVYVVAAIFMFEKHPEGWAMALPGALLYATLIGLMVSGIALGIASVSRNTRAATLIMLFGFIVLDLIASNVLTDITADPNFQILSPFAAFQQQSEWIFEGVDSGAEFPQWWGIAVLIGLTVVGWALLGWRHPRVRGAEA
jgi:ABC-type transport system involved in multi-copper enzyme maturation permease subunit